jgi:hypothetical protein
MTRRAPIAALAATLLALVLGSAGCGAVADTSPSPPGVLLTVETRGGLCPGGPCGRTIVVERDGRVHEAAKPPNDLGVVPAEPLAALDLAIRTTDFAQLRSRPFTGTCPTAYDGQEVVFEFGAPGGVERIASCEVEVDPSAPLFVAVANAVGPFMALPTR